MTNGLEVKTEELISKTEAAKLLKINPRTLERYQEQGRIIPRYVNENGKRKVKYSLEEICSFGSIILPDTTTTTNAGELNKLDYQEVDRISLFAELANKFIEVYERSQSPIDVYKDLDESVEKGWLLSTASVQKLIGLKPTDKDGYCWANYVFKVEGKIKNGYAWRVYSNNGGGNK